MKISRIRPTTTVVHWKAIPRYTFYCAIADTNCWLYGWAGQIEPTFLVMLLKLERKHRLYSHIPWERIDNSNTQTHSFNYALLRGISIEQCVRQFVGCYRFAAKSLFIWNVFHFRINEASMNAKKIRQHALRYPKWCRQLREYIIPDLCSISFFSFVVS